MGPTGKFEDISLSELSLEPMPDPKALNYQPPKSATSEAVAKKALPRPSKSTDRRGNGERRKELRFEADRRSGKDRRPRKGFEPGKIP